MTELKRVLEHDGKVYRKGDPIGIKGEKGPFRFQYWDTTSTGKDVVTVWWDNHHFCNFYLNKIKPLAKQAEVLCPEHKKYKAVRVPKTDCARCWGAYGARHEEVDVNISDYEIEEVDDFEF